PRGRADAPVLDVDVEAERDAELTLQAELARGFLRRLEVRGVDVLQLDLLHFRDLAEALETRAPRLGHPALRRTAADRVGPCELARPRAVHDLDELAPLLAERFVDAAR